MAVSLRVVIGSLTALIVLVVASTTLAITYTVSIAAVRNAGEQLAAAMSNTVSREVTAFFHQAEDHVNVMRNLSKVHDVMMPSDDPEFANGEGWGLKYMYMFRAMNTEVNYTYSSLSYIFDDGSIIAGLDHQDARGWYTETVQSNRRLPNGTMYRTSVQNTFHTVTKQPWDASVRGPAPRAVFDQDASSNTGYQTVINLAAGQERCQWFAPSLDHNEIGRPRFVLYGQCVIHNASGVLMGIQSVGRFLDTLPSFLEATTKTPKTQMFIIDNFRMIVATTHPSPAAVYGDPSELAVRSNCASSAEISAFTPTVIGCRAWASEFPYAPLRDAVSADSNFVRGTGEVFKFGKLDGENYYYISKRIPSSLGSYAMNLVVFMPESDVLGDIVSGRNLAIGITAAVFVATSIISFVVIGYVLSPVDEVARRMYLTAKLQSAEPPEDKNRKPREPSTPAQMNPGDMHMQSFGQQSGDVGLERRETTAMFREETSGNAYIVEDSAAVQATHLNKSNLAEIRALQTAYITMDTAIRSFTKYVPRDVVKELMASNQMCEIAMRPTRCSMLFTDIASFTSICERVPPHILSELVRLYFERSSAIVMGHGGVIDKFIGDCIMAVWGAPTAIDHHELRSTLCGIQLIEETQSNPLKESFEAANECLTIRVGVASGEVLAGNMGSQMRMSYTVIGDDVNLASRLEGLNKQWGTSVMVSEDTAEELVDYIHMRYVISIAVVGKEKPVKVYEAMGPRKDVDHEALGKSTAVMDPSESMTQTQVAADHDMEELAKRYGEVHDDGTSKLASASKLLRRCLRRRVVAPDELVFATAYEEALRKWDKGDFAGCATALRGFAEREDLPSWAGTCLSVTKVLAASEHNLQQPPSSGPWTGVWVANEK